MKQKKVLKSTNSNTKSFNFVQKAKKMVPKAKKPEVSISRNNVNSPKGASKVDKRKRKMLSKGIIAAVVAVLVLIVVGVGIGAFVAKNGQKQPSDDETSQTQPVGPSEPELPTENTDDLVPEPEITDNSSYQVAAHKPRFLSIPSLELYNVPVIEIGIGGDNKLGDPDNIKVVGWHYRSALPGQLGKSRREAMMIDGHGGDLGYGIFKTLPRIAVGAEIIIETGDGRKFTYVVADKVNKTRGSDADNYMGTAYKSPQPGVPSLTLITCTGKWLPAEQTYILRLFVRAVLKS